MIKLRILSLGAGVQSTTMALMASRGLIGPMPDCAIFADTGWEPVAVYDHLRWLTSHNVLRFPVHVVQAGNLHTDALAGRSPRSGKFGAVPWFVLSPRGKKGMGRRQCTTHYKVEPIRKKIREMLGVGPRGRIPAGTVEKWLGISKDEIIRATRSKVRFEINRHPLLELGMSRKDCLRWLDENDYPTPPKSACIGCPFHDNATWRDLKMNRPEEWAQAIEVDRAIRDLTWNSFKGQQFMHAQRVPLDQVDLMTAEDRGQINMFNNECEGMCGT